MYIMPILSKKVEEKQQQQEGKSGYWQNELYSLGVLEPKARKELNDNKEELENLADNIKQAMFQDYKIAYGEKGDRYREEAKSTVTVA
jgi:hypothetical protein